MILRLLFRLAGLLLFLFLLPGFVRAVRKSFRRPGGPRKVRRPKTSRPYEISKEDIIDVAFTECPKDRDPEGKD